MLDAACPLSGQPDGSKCAVRVERLPAAERTVKPEGPRPAEVIMVLLLLAAAGVAAAAAVVAIRRAPAAQEAEPIARRCADHHPAR